MIRENEILIPETGSEFKIWRKNVKKWSQQRASEELGCSRSRLAHIEADNEKLSFYFINKIRCYETSYKVRIMKNMEILEKRDHIKHSYAINYEIDKLLRIINAQDINDANRSIIFIARALNILNKTLCLKYINKNNKQEFNEKRELLNENYNYIYKIAQLLLYDTGKAFSDDVGKGSWAIYEDEIKNGD